MSQYYRSILNTLTVPFTNTKSILLDGVDDFVDCGNDSSLSFDRTDSFSLSAWINSSSGFNGTIVGKFDGSSVKGYYMGMNSSTNKLRFTLRKSSTYILVETTDEINLNQWSHVLATYNGNQDASGVVLYVNGTAVSLTVVLNNLTTSISNSDPLRIGSNDSATFFDGNIDEVAIFNSELSASDVTAIYGTGVPNDISSL